MNPLALAPVIVITITAIVALMLTVYSWRWRADPGGIYFSLLMLAITIYAFTNAAELNSIQIATKLIWAKISYLGVVSVAPLWFLFSVSYSSQRNWRNPRIFVIWIFPLVTLVLAATNEWHRLIWATITPFSAIPGSRLIYTHGIAFWLYTVYAYILVIVGTYRIVRSVWRSPWFFRRQVVVLTVCMLIPWLSSLLYVINVDPWPGLDLTPLALLISGLGIAWAFYRYQLFNIVPVAREMMFENLGDGVFVLDHKNRILDINPIARLWMGMGDEMIGRNIFEVIQIDPAVLPFKDEARTKSQLILGKNVDRRIYDLTISALHDPNRTVKGYLVLLHDITVEKLQNAELTALQSVSQTVVSSLEIGQICDTVVNLLHDTFGYEFVSIYHLRGEMLIMGAQTGYEAERIFQQIPVISGISGRAVRTRKPQLVKDVKTDPDFLMFSDRVASEICIPLIKDQQVLGTLNIESADSRTLAETDLRLLNAFAGQAAIAIENARLHEAEKRKSQRLEALYTATSILMSTLELDPLLEQILVAAVDAIPASGKGSLLLVDPETHRLLIHNHVGYKNKDIENVVFDMDGSGYAAKALRDRRPLRIEDVDQTPDLSYLGENEEVRQIRSAIVAPLMLKDQVLGAISIDSTQPNTFTEDDLQLLIGLANIATIALHNAQLHQDVQQLSVTDALTTCLNRRGLFELGQREVARVQRQQSPMTALMIDLDEFKNINDVYGHLVGDRVLQEVAEEIKKGVRSIDIIGRYGGDEFVVLLPDTGKEEGKLVAERIRSHIGQVSFQERVALTISVGLASLDNSSADLEALIERADHALLQSKFSGRNCVSIDSQPDLYPSHRASRSSDSTESRTGI